MIECVLNLHLYCSILSKANDLQNRQIIHLSISCPLSTTIFAGWRILMGKKVSMLLHFALDSCCVWRHVAFHYFATLFRTDLALCGHRTSYCDFASALLWLQNLKHLPPVSCLLAWIQLYYRTLVLRTFHQQARTWRRVPRCAMCLCVISWDVFTKGLQLLNGHI